jgi:hypothetical protein
MRPEGLTFVDDSCPERYGMAIDLRTSCLQKAKQECSGVVRKKGKDLGEEEKSGSGAASRLSRREYKTPRNA